jgi:uncharacterized protein (DUF58 family)
MRGTSTEFAEYRLYRQGDDPRRIDWRLLARSDRAYIRLATDRTVLPTMIVLDSSASMAFPVATHAKWHRAQEIAVALAAVAHAGGDPIGIAVSDRRGHTRLVTPRTRRGVVDEIARVVIDAEAGGGAPLAPLVRATQSARIAIISDLLGDSDDVLREIRAHAAGGGEAHVVHIVAREELDLPRRTLLAADPEDPSLERLLTETTRRAYEEAFGEWRAEVARQVRFGGAGYTEVVTDEPAAHAVRRITRPAGKA